MIEYFFSLQNQTLIAAVHQRLDGRQIHLLYSSTAWMGKMAVQIICLCQIIRESDYELLLFCSQNWVIYACSDFALLENILSEASEKKWTWTIWTKLRLWVGVGCLFCLVLVYFLFIYLNHCLVYASETVEK